MTDNPFDSLWAEIEEKESQDYFLQKEEFNNKLDAIILSVENPDSQNKILSAKEYFGKDISGILNYNFKNTFVNFDFLERIDDHSDTSFAFAIYDKSNPEKYVAKLGFDFTREGEIKIAHIQAARKSYPGINYPVNWDDILLNSAIQFAYAYDFDLVLNPADKLTFYNCVMKGDFCAKSSDKHKETMIKRYDKLALKNGFFYDSERNIYFYPK